jgi:hypothetical protein
MLIGIILFLIIHIFNKSPHFIQFAESQSWNLQIYPARQRTVALFVKMRHTGRGIHEVHTFGMIASHIALGVTMTVIRSHSCCHGFRISSYNKPFLVTLQLMLPWLPHFQGYDTVWFVSDVTT